MRMNRTHQSIVTHIPGRGMRGQTVLFLFLLLLSACSGRGKGDAGERIITVTMEPQRYFTEAIAGDKFTVRSMVPKGSSPETYDPTPQQLVSLMDGPVDEQYSPYPGVRHLNRGGPDL